MKYLIILLNIFFISCTSNEISCDIDGNIKTCDRSKIYNIYIEGVNNDEAYSINKKDNEIGLNSINLFKIDLKYGIKDYLGNSILNSEFILKPNSKYKIYNKSNGDRIAKHIEIEIDEFGKKINPLNKTKE